MTELIFHQFVSSNHSNHDLFNEYLTTSRTTPHLSKSTDEQFLFDPQIRDHDFFTLIIIWTNV